ncbi:MAG: hypothetical protein ABSG51_07490 [Terracidiphilus sp.]|jgi:hypothetical protein
MKHEFAVASSSAVLTMALFLSAAVMAPSSSFAQTGDSHAADVVSAQGALADTLDSSKTKPGDPVRVTLSNKVRLTNGTELPAGTAIIGVVSTDDMQLKGTTTLALRFTKAETKGGQVVPIKATIVGIFPPESEDISGRPITPGDEETGSLPQHPDSVDELGALPGVDLHSKVSSSNSGVLVTTSKHDVKLKRGSEIAFTVAAQAD